MLILMYWQHTSIVLCDGFDLNYTWPKQVKIEYTEEYKKTPVDKSIEICKSARNSILFPGPK